MPIALAAVAVVGLGLSVYQTVDAKKRQKEAEKQAQEYERQQLRNAAEDIQISTRGSELQQQNLNNQVATATDVLRAGGTRAILGGLPTIYDSVLQSNAQIAAGIDQQYNEREFAKAQGAMNIQAINEQRQRDDLLGIGNALNTANQQYAQGINSTITSIGNVANAASLLKPSNVTQSVGTNSTAKLGSVGGLFSRGSEAVAIRPNIANMPMLTTPKVTVNQPYYGDLLNQYNRILYGR